MRRCWPESACRKLVFGVILCSALIGRVYAHTGSSSLAITDEPRPVLKAILALESRYGFAITYEEPEYDYPGDLKDVTKSRKDLNSFAPGKAPKVVIPLGGSLRLTLPTATQLSQAAMYAVLQQLVESWKGSNQGGANFDVEEDGPVFHVVPIEVRDRNGNWKSVESILAMPISLPTESRTEYETWRTICSDVAANAGVRVYAMPNGGLILGPPQSAQYELGSDAEPAESVLMRAIKVMGQERSWYLLYDPTTRAYYMNIDQVQGTLPSSSSRSSAPNPQTTPAHAPFANCRPADTTCPP